MKIRCENKLNVVVIGSGMYVCGRGTRGYGTIIPALCEWQKKTAALGEIYLAGNSVKGIREAKSKIRRIQEDMGVRSIINYYPQDRDDPHCFEEALSAISRPACAIVAVPDNLHKKVAQAAMKVGLHTLVVKPLVPTVKEAFELTRLQKKSDLYCAVEFHKRYDYANMKMKEVIERGAIGDILYFIAEFSQRKSIPTKIFRKWVETTNIFQYLGIHYVDIIYFLTKARPLRAMATGQKRWLRARGIDTYDSIEAVIEWQANSGNKFVSHILTNWIDPEKTSAMSDQRLKVIGAKGRIESDQKYRGLRIVTDEGGLEEPNPYFCAGYGSKGNVSYKGYGIESIHQFLDDVVRVEGGAVELSELERERPTFAQSIVPTLVLEAVNGSLKQKGRWIEIKYREQI